MQFNAVTAVSSVFAWSHFFCFSFCVGVSCAGQPWRRSDSVRQSISLEAVKDPRLPTKPTLTTFHLQACGANSIILCYLQRKVNINQSHADTSPSRSQCPSLRISLLIPRSQPRSIEAGRIAASSVFCIAETVRCRFYTIIASDNTKFKIGS